MIAAPLTMLVVVRPLLTEFGHGPKTQAGLELPAHRREGRAEWVGERRCGGVAWSALAVVFIAGAAWSTLPGPARRAGRAARARRASCGRSCRSCTASRSSTRARTATPPTSCSVPTPTCRWSSSPTRWSRRTRKSRSTPATPTRPIDFDSFNRGTLDRFRYVITGRGGLEQPGAAQLPADREDRPPSSSGKRTGPTPPTATCCSRAPRRAPCAHCASPEVRILLASGGRRLALPAKPVIGTKPEWSSGSTWATAKRPRRRSNLPAGTWDLSLQYFSPFGLSISAPGFSRR